MKTQNLGIVIILNGASASGKSTLQKELQKLFPSPYLGIGLDTFFVGVLPERFVVGLRQEGDIDSALVMQGEAIIDTSGNRLFELLVGPMGDRVIYGMHHAIAAYARQGNNCIVDYIAYKQEWISDLCSALEGIPVYLVGVDCALEILEQREKDRGRSFVEGHARSHYAIVHEHMDNLYDVRVNTDVTPVADSAKKIYECIIADSEPTAFKTLCKR
jgi:chloramphenicol 3-O phosphotransferase